MAPVIFSATVKTYSANQAANTKAWIAMFACQSTTSAPRDSLALLMNGDE